MRDVFIQRLLELTLKDRSIYLVTGDLGFGVFNKFREQLPEQFINAGVAEQNMTGMATGLAMTGHTVFTYSIGNFPTMRCLEQIRNDACYHDANVKVVSVGGGFSYGSLGMSHHATEDLSIMRTLPGLTVVAPCDKWETAEATSALASLVGPCYLRLDKSSAPDTHTASEQFRLGKARVVKQGSDVTLIACGGIMRQALTAADTLAGKGISCRVLSMHTIKPLDSEAVIAAAKETGGIVTVEENTVDGGLGSAVGEVCLEASATPGFFHRIGLPGVFSCIVGSQDYLLHRYEMDAEAISKAVLRKLA
ncbi:MAG: transketolase family protein [Armatimonadota bacterium]